MSDLFAYARAHDPDTSKAAAASVNTTALEAGVIGALKTHPDGLTSYEIAEILRLSLVSVSPRLRPLADRGVVEATEKKRPTPSGRLALVWKMKE